MGLGATLRLLMKERALSMRKLASLTGIDTATISRIANGKQQAKLDHLQQFAAHLGVPLGRLFEAAGYDVGNSGGSGGASAGAGGAAGGAGGGAGGGGAAGAGAGAAAGGGAAGAGAGAAAGGGAAGAGIAGSSSAAGGSAGAYGAGSLGKSRSSGASSAGGASGGSDGVGDAGVTGNGSAMGGVSGTPSSWHESVDSIQRVLQTSNFIDPHFTAEHVRKELSKYELYALTDEGERTIRDSFRSKIESVGGAGPFIEQLRSLYELFGGESTSAEKRAIAGSALLYFILSTDIIPDYAFPFGYLDDAIAVQLVLDRLAEMPE
ncbi:DUF1232 domain-containing protein [Cohnella lubricantis]|uniref:DUF1232 domain-containing protein n=4 Tax=Cohnella lubricantis TaxID=2163172 RepID=A0A841T8L2_9BACL|nr:DUF1232 domain-containing protein [Cohnella lubricantis]